ASFDFQLLGINARDRRRRHIQPVIVRTSPGVELRTRHGSLSDLSLEGGLILLNGNGLSDLIRAELPVGGVPEQAGAKVSVVRGQRVLNALSRNAGPAAAYTRRSRYAGQSQTGNPRARNAVHAAKVQC